MLLAVDVIEEVDRILDDTVANVAIVSAGLGSWGGFADDNAFAQFAVQVDFVVATLEELTRNGSCKLYLKKKRISNHSDSVLRRQTYVLPPCRPPLRFGYDPGPAARIRSGPISDGDRPGVASSLHRSSTEGQDL